MSTEEKKTKPVGVKEVEEVKTKGLFGKIKETISTKKITSEKFDELFSGVCRSQIISMIYLIVFKYFQIPRKNNAFFLLGYSYDLLIIKAIVI